MKTTRERFRSLAENDFKEIEAFKVQVVADAKNLLDNYFESLKNNEDPEVEKLIVKHNNFLELIDGISWFNLNLIQRVCGLGIKIRIF